VKTYVVGGAVRDALLGLPVSDRDHVVVGASPEAMTRAGFRPVGSDFPVFLHPETHEEYALARTERKSGHGYQGFTFHAAPDVTLEQDLARRDLTINAMAREEDGAIIDPYNGRADLAARVLRHVGPAFAEDPVRILRVARFAARFHDFSLAPETLQLMRGMVAAGEVDYLVAERVWKELSRGLMEAMPSRMFLVLRECGALTRLLPELDVLFGVPQNPKSHPEVDTGDHVMRVIDQAARRGYPLPVRYAALCHDLGKGTTPREQWPHHGGHEARGVEPVREVSRRLRAPRDCAELARIVARWHGEAHGALEMHAPRLLGLLHATDALRQPGRFEAFLQACQADYSGRPGFEAREFPSAERLRAALEAALAVDAGAVANGLTDGDTIREAVARSRTEAIRARLENLSAPSEMPDVCRDT
jgi:tRNA nucleotidyltransferase (CCA-adding enzyme)